MALAISLPQVADANFSFWHLLLQANLKVPLPFASRQGRSGVGEYLLSFLDENMLVGRAQNGTFVFVREQ